MVFGCVLWVRRVFRLAVHLGSTSLRVAAARESPGARAAPRPRTPASGVRTAMKHDRMAMAHRIG
eukprot:700344-Prymnesium_polylepis.2